MTLWVDASESHRPTKFGGHKPCGSRDITYLRTYSRPRGQSDL